MKSFLIAIVVLLLLFGMTVPGMAAEKEPEGTITLSGAWAIYPTAVAWAEAFQKLHPKIKVDVSAGGAGKGAADAINGLVDIGMVSRDPDPSELAKGITAVYILHDAVFPVIGEKNPALNDILKTGIKKDTWAGLYVRGDITDWDQVTGTKIGKPVHVYTRSDTCGAAASWASYLGKKQEDLKGIGVYGDPGLLESAQKDPLGIAYSNFSYVFTRGGTVVQGVKAVPIDANENGIADPEEIYENREDAIQAIETGKYPVTRKNYFFIKKETAKPIVMEFIKFTLGEEGTKTVVEVGASLPIKAVEREQVLKNLGGK